MDGWYQEHIADTGRSAALFLMLGFVITFAITRTVTHRIRAKQAAAATDDSSHGDASGKVKDVYIGGVHIHHQVWGILLVLLVGLLEFRFQPASPWVEVLALLFGAGAALALDEFALWLYMKDVYWTEEGKKSIDAVLLAFVVCLALLMSASPLGVPESEFSTQGLLLASVFILLHFTYTAICLLKGKIVTGLLGLPVPMLSFIGSLRLAKPSSFWARRFYSEAKMARAQRRFGVDYRERIDRIHQTVTHGRPRDSDDPPDS